MLLHFASFCFILRHFSSFCFIIINRSGNRASMKFLRNDKTLHFLFKSCQIQTFCARGQLGHIDRSASRVSPATRYSRVFASFCLILASFRLILSHFGFFWPSRGRAKSQRAIASEWAENINLESPTGGSQPGRSLPSLKPNSRVRTRPTREYQPRIADRRNSAWTFPFFVKT